MYLISLYFDEKSDRQFRATMQGVAKDTGNSFMIDGNVPPHITVAAFETKDEVAVMEVLDNIVSTIKSGQLQWVSIGTFLPGVIYVQPVLNQYLSGLSVILNEKLNSVCDTKLSRVYQPYNWVPHLTVAKQLSEEQLDKAFKYLRKRFVPFYSEAVRIGIAKTNPHRDLKVWDLVKQE